MVHDPHEQPAANAHIVVLAAANAHAAGVCASLLRDRIELLCESDRALDLTAGAMPRWLAEVNLAAERLESAVARVLDHLDPDTPQRAAKAAALARETVCISLTCLTAPSSQPTMLRPCA